MKKIFFLIGIVPIFLISCAVNKNALRTAYNTPPSDEQKYFGDTISISETAALAMIGTFPKHKYRGLHKKRLDSTWTQFNVQTLSQILNNSNVDSLKIFSAVSINPDNESTFRLPTVVIQIKLKETTVAIAKGSSTTLAQYQYLSSSQLCPPPKGDCRVKPQ
ncbi:MAG TPA: hypothetical protein VN726_03720 [Hanamia sp.]|jgi:hypothetical protein|nr:hypothetical protein [Hanamia sp.]